MLLQKNFADPSGSSPAENPPGNMIICDWLIALSNSSTESRMSVALRFLEYFLQWYLGTCTLKGLRAVILTVRSREDRNEYGRLCYFILAYIDVLCMCVYRHSVLFSLSSVARVRWEDSFECFFRSRLQLLPPWKVTFLCIQISVHRSLHRQQLGCFFFIIGRNSSALLLLRYYRIPVQIRFLQ